MTNIIEIICENLGGKVEVPMGTPLSEVAKRVAPGPYPFLAALVNNRIKELYYKIYTPVSVRFVDITSFSGIRVYQRTSWFILQKAVRDLFPGKTLHIRHSMGQNGFYCEVEGIDEFSHEQAAALEGRMRYLVAQDLPISRMKILTSEVRARYAAQGLTDKIALLDTRPRLYSDLYTLGDTDGYFYGALAPSTGFIDRFGIEPYYTGFYLALPLRTTAEDFGFYTHRYPSLFYRLGVGAASGKPHTSTFSPDEKAITTGIAFMQALALKLLNEK